MPRKGLILVGLLALVAPRPAAAQHESGAAVHEGHHANAFGLFGGQLRKDGETGPSFGAEYERHLGLFGLGAIVERNPDADVEGTTVAVGALHLHPGAGFRFSAGAGIESVSGADGGSKALYRLAAAYDIDLGERFALAPTASLDFVDGDHAWVFGGAFLVHF